MSNCSLKLKTALLQNFVRTDISNIYIALQSIEIGFRKNEINYAFHRFCAYSGIPHPRGDTISNHTKSDIFNIEYFYLTNYFLGIF